MFFLKGFWSEYRGGCDMRDPPWQGTPWWFHYPHHFSPCLSRQGPPLKLTWPHRSRWRSTTKVTAGLPHRSQWKSTTKVTAEVNHTGHSRGQPYRPQWRSITKVMSLQRSTTQVTEVIQEADHTQRRADSAWSRDVDGLVLELVSRRGSLLLSENHTPKSKPYRTGAKQRRPREN